MVRTSASISPKIGTSPSTRLTKIKELLKLKKLDACLISSAQNIFYLTNFSGFSESEREGFLLITQTSNHIITDARLSSLTKKIPDFSLHETSPLLTRKKLFTDLAQKYKIHTVGIEEENITVIEYHLLKSIFEVVKPFSLYTVKLQKEPRELLAIQKACTIGDQAFTYILDKLVPGVTEKEIAQELEQFMRQEDATSSFAPIVAFGEHSAIPHHQTGMMRLTNQSGFILLDFGVKVDNYCSDMTRTVFIGIPSDKQKKMYETVREAQQKAFEYLATPDKRIASDVDNIARNHITANGFPSIPHSLGHGIGLAVHEGPYLASSSQEIIQNDMVFTLEPGIYYEDFGGVRIEDVVHMNGFEPVYLTHSPKEIIVL